MYNVNNKNCINNIALKSFYTNKTRNIIAIIAIALTCILFTTVFTVSMSIIDTVQDSYFRQIGTTQHSGYKYLTAEMAEKVEADSEVFDISYRIIVGEVVNEEFTKLRTEISYIDENYAKNSFNIPTIGKLPQSVDEITVTDTILYSIGLPIEVGQKVTLDIIANGQSYTDEFTVSGIIELDNALPVSQIFVSKEYAEKVAPVWTGENNEIYYENMAKYGNSYTAGCICISFNFASSSNIEVDIDALNKRMGFDMTLVDDATNWGYVSSNLDIDSIIFISILIIIIIFSGYLIIYNVFLISVSNDIKFFGLLKTIGTTAKQLRVIIYKQAILLTFLGTPLGLILGYLIATELIPILFSVSSLDSFVISLNPIIFVLSTIFTLITVLISCTKPAKFISKLSPIESIRYTEGFSKRKKVKKAKRITPLSMAISNMSRNKKKTFLVIVSLSLSVLIFNVTYTFTNGFDMDEFISGFTVSDFLVSHSSILNYTAQDRTINGITDDLVEQVENLDGVEDIGRTYVYLSMHTLAPVARERALTALEENSEYLHGSYEDYVNSIDEQGMIASIYGVSENLIDSVPTVQVSDYLAKNDLTDEEKEKFFSGDYVITTGFFTMSDPYYAVGEKVAIDFDNGNIKEYEVLSVGTLASPIDKGYSDEFDLYFILPEEEFLAQLGDYQALNLTINVEDEFVDKTEKFLSNYTTIVDNQLDYESKKTFEDEFYELKNTFLISGLTLSSILGLIGIVNFINTMITSINSRKLELAMLQSMGMTNEQMKKMLISEGMFYGGFVIVFLASLGNLLTYYIVDTLSKIMITSNYSFELMPFLVSTVILILVSVFTPILIFRNIKSKSIVERLREVT